ncbi:MAG: ABC transporter ATP-binding protein [Sporichthyaceae bacterium]|nr:ABC transporter ATP-binding protein [Sporichthyaceae bacterium]
MAKQTPANLSGRGGTIELVELCRIFDDRPAVDGIDLHIPQGELFSVLGPSGCGKTTTLRMIAGFERPNGGRVLIDGVDVTDDPPHRRPVNTVFQSYALFPHLSVADNVGYGLRWRKDVDKAERRAKIGAALELVQLSAFADRRPAQLSGGEQQRVALARALVLQPSVLLLDEPLGALDARLRKSLRQELVGIQREVGITFVFVTHDQEEALELSDRVAVMDHGRVVQCGTPREVYESPQTEFVADFLGVANVLEAACGAPAGGSRRSVTIGSFPLTATEPADLNGNAPEPNSAGKVVIRPERIRLSTPAEAGANQIPGMVDRLVYLGPTTQVVVTLPHGPQIQALVTNDADEQMYPPGTPVTVTFPQDALRLLAPAS